MIKRLLNLLATLRNLPPFDERNVLSIVKDKASIKCFVGGKELSTAQTSQLKAEAKALKQFFLWSLLQDSAKKQAYLSMFENAKTIDDIKWGKALLYAGSINKSIVDQLADL